MIKIRVPATSANMGCGFDSMGIALNIYNYIYLEENDKIEIVSKDGLSIPTDENNLIYKCVKKVYDRVKVPLQGIKIIQNSMIPMTRGLGSSSACVAAGLYGANELLGNPLSTDEILDMAAEIEGHPDNSTPAIVGGFTVSVLDKGRVNYVKVPDMGKKIKFVAFIPDFKMRTDAARAVLPKVCSMKKSVHNLSRAALFALSMSTGNFHNLKVASDDRLHQPFRLKLIDFSKEIFTFCKACDVHCVFLSGAGPTMLAMIDADDNQFYNKAKGFIEKYRPQYKVLELECDDEGIKVEKTDILDI